MVLSEAKERCDTLHYDARQSFFLWSGALIWCCREFSRIFDTPMEAWNAKAPTLHCAYQFA
jgi:hypothetical protein